MFLLRLNNFHCLSKFSSNSRCLPHFSSISTIIRTIKSPYAQGACSFVLASCIRNAGNARSVWSVDGKEASPSARNCPPATVALRLRQDRRPAPATCSMPRAAPGTVFGERLGWRVVYAAPEPGYVQSKDLTEAPVLAAGNGTASTSGKKWFAMYFSATSSNGRYVYVSLGRWGRRWAEGRLVPRGVLFQTVLPNGQTLATCLLSLSLSRNLFALRIRGPSPGCAACTESHALRCSYFSLWLIVN